MKNFFYGVFATTLFQLATTDPSQPIFAVWAALSIGVVIGALIVLASSAVDYNDPEKPETQNNNHF